MSPLLRRYSPEKWAGLYAMFMLTAFVLWTPPSGYTNFVGPKHQVFLAASGLFLLGCLPALARRPNLTRRQAWPLAMAGGLAVLFLLSALCSDYPQVVWLGNRRQEGFLTLALYLGIFAAMAVWGRLGEGHGFAAAGASILVFALVLAQFLGYNPLGLYPDGLGFHDRGLAYSGEYLGTIGNSDLLSAYLTMMVLYLMGTYLAVPGRGFCLAGGFFAWLSLLLSEVSAGPVAIAAALALALPVCLWRGVGLRRMGEVLALLVLGVLLKSALGYRYANGELSFFLQFGWMQAALAAAVALGAVGAVFLRRLPEGRGYPKPALAVVLLALAVLAAVLGFLWAYQGDNQTLQEISALLHGNPPPTLGSSRIAIWTEALELGWKKPWLGGGPDTYQLRSTLIFSRALPDGGVRRTSVDAAHNEYLNLWVNTGLPSMLVYLAMLGMCLLPALRRPGRETLPLLLPALGYAIHGLFGISQSVVSPLFYLFLGALVHAGSMNPGEAA